MNGKGKVIKVMWPIVGLAIAVLAAGCASPAESGEIKSDKDRLPASADEQEIAGLVSGNSTFAYDLYQELSTSEDNLFYSPYSISLALAMTFAGARGETEGEMAQTLHFNLPQPQLHQTFNALDTTLNGYGVEEGDAAESIFQLHIANAIWGQTGYQFLESFLDLLAENYGAGLRTLDFVGDADGATEKINGWVSEQTEGKIKDLIPPGMLNDLVRLVLTNAIYFKGQWAMPFEESVTRDDTFKLLDGSTITVPMMSQTETFRYTEGDGYQAVALPYQGAPVSMILLLPATGQFEEIEAAFGPELLADISQDFEYQLVALTMPKFTFESEFNLNEALAGMGMVSAFGEGADFSGMTGGRDLFISDVVHKAFVSVDEAGTEAAAATAVIMVESAAVIDEPVEMKVDRPFLFLIRDDANGTILFAGRVLNPAG